MTSKPPSLGDVANRVAGGLTDPAAFFASVRATMGPLKQSQVVGFNFLLVAMAADKWPVAWTAYGLATAYHEVAGTMQPIRERGGASYLHRMYDINGARPAKARELGNLSPGDGVKFAGRGYVQLTGRANYKKAGEVLGVQLLLDPDKALDPEIAANIMVKGMRAAWFTGRGMGHYLPKMGPAKVDAFREARRIINGTDKAGLIADHAMRFQQALILGGWK